RATLSRIIQVLTGHCFVGAYYARFVPLESTQCPCGHPVQTREHVLTQCRLHTWARRHLRNVSDTLSLPIILGTPDGVCALQRFIEESGAFSK
ncbi:hypothetical protein BV25DRAFT_1779343, partial [Artomyces pyxidatus]